MTAFIGRRRVIKLGREDSYGTKSTKLTVIPNQDLKITYDKALLRNVQAYGTIEAGSGSEAGAKGCEVSIQGVLQDGTAGIFLKALFGTDSPTVVDSPEAGANTHTFTLKQTNVHPSYTIVWEDLVQTKMATGLLLSSLEVNIVAVEYVTYTAVFTGRAPVTTTETFAVTTENLFTSNHAELKIANDVSSLSGATALSITTGSVSFTKNAERFYSWGNNDVRMVTNNEFDCSGSFELLYEDDSLYNLFDNTTQQALSIELTHDQAISGTATPTYPKLSFVYAGIDFESFDH